MICEVVYNSSTSSLTQGIKLASINGLSNDIKIAAQSNANLYVSFKVGGIQTFDEWMNENRDNLTKEEWFIKKSKEGFLEVSSTEDEKNRINSILSFQDLMNYFAEKGVIDIDEGESLPGNIETLYNIMEYDSLFEMCDNLRFIDIEDYYENNPGCLDEYTIKIESESYQHITCNDKIKNAIFASGIYKVEIYKSDNLDQLLAEESVDISL